jgi:hypothetical protein
MQDSADDAAIIHPLLASNIRWQMRLDPLPLLIAQPEQIPAHEFKSFPENESLSYCPGRKINEF